MIERFEIHRGLLAKVSCLLLFCLEGCTPPKSPNIHTPPAAPNASSKSSHAPSVPSSTSSSGIPRYFSECEPLAKAENGYKFFCKGRTTDKREMQERVNSGGLYRGDGCQYNGELRGHYCQATTLLTEIPAEYEKAVADFPRYFTACESLSERHPADIAQPLIARGYQFSCDNQSLDKKGMQEKIDRWGGIYRGDDCRYDRELGEHHCKSTSFLKEVPADDPTLEPIDFGKVRKQMRQ